MWGFAPAETLATLFGSPPVWVTSPLTRLAVVGIGVIAVLAIFLVPRIARTNIQLGSPTFRPDANQNILGRVPVSLLSGRKQGRATLKVFNLDGTDFDGGEYILMTEARLQQTDSRAILG
jgi:hypothetical protein